MKNQGILCLLIVACLFASCLLGFFLGRRTSPEPILVTKTPSASQSAQASDSLTGAATQPLLVNINTATADELQLLPGIGPVLAQRIIDYRQENGPFESVSQLTLVSGVGLTLLENLMDYITVGGTS